MLKHVRKEGEENSLSREGEGWGEGILGVLQSRQEEDRS
jgi:hypothetical protein